MAIEPTHEVEITSPVDLCLADGKTLNPRARGWSRRPLHRANMRGVWGRTKRWDYWAILSDEFVFGIVYADVDYIGLGGVWWADLRTGESGGVDIVAPLGRRISLPEISGSYPLSLVSPKLTLRITDSALPDSADPPDSADLPEGTDRTTDRDIPGRRVHIDAEWVDKDGTTASLDLVVTQPSGHESVNVVIPWSTDRYNFTTKEQALPAVGTFNRDGQTQRIGIDSPAWGTLDVGRGRWPYSTRWNWGGGAGRCSTGEVVGIQFGAKWTEGTGFTENGIIVDGRLHKIGRELDWQYSWDNPMDPWRVRDEGGALDLTLTPSFDKHTRTSALVMSTEVHQVFGTWSGSVVSEDGRQLIVESAPGFAEESRSRW